MSITITIAGNAVIFNEETFQLHYKMDERQRCQFTVLDYAGTAVYSYGQQIIVTDSTLGVLYEGYVIDDKQDKSNVYPDPTIEHQIDTIDNIYLADKRSTLGQSWLYSNPTQAGKIVVDMLSNVLSQEGVTAPYALQDTDTQALWAQGTLANTVATANVGDGDLELTTSTSVSASYMVQSDWSSGTFSNAQANSGGDVSLIGFTRNWDDGSVANQTLFGNGSPTQGVTSGEYFLTCTANNETRSRLDFASTWQNGTIEVDMIISTDSAKKSFTWRTTNWTNGDGSYAYAVELRPSLFEIRRGTNGGANSTTQIVAHTFSPALAAGTYRVRIDLNGSSFTGSFNGTQYLSVTDATYSAAGMIALRNRNDTTITTITDNFDNFGVMTALSGTWTSASTSINAISSIAGSVITWSTALSQGGTVLVQTSIDGGSTYQNCTSGGVIPGLTAGSSGTGKSVIVKITLSTTTTATMPDISSLSWSVIGGYTASGTRSNIPLGNDTMVRGNVASGWGTSFDGQAYTQYGAGATALTSNEATITNTSGDVHMQLGSTTASDMDAVARVAIQAGTTAGIELRFVGTTGYYTVVSSDNPIRLYKLNDGTVTNGSTIVDSGSQAQNGTVVGSGLTTRASFIPNVLGDTAINFGSSSYISIPTTGLPTVAGAWTMGAWVKMPGSLPGGSPTIMSFGSAASAWDSAYLIYLGGTFYLANATTLTISGGSVSANGVYFPCVTYDGTNASLYVNGNLVAGPSAMPFTIVLAFAQIGFNNGSSYWSGGIQAPLMCNSALSAGTIAALYAAGIETANGTYYRLAISTTIVSIVKVNGPAVTLASTAMAISTGTPYKMRFRVTGSGPVSLYGRVWLSTSAEPSTWTVTATD